MKHEFREIVEAPSPDLPLLYVHLIWSLDALKVKELGVGLCSDPERPGCGVQAMARAGHTSEIMYASGTRIMDANDRFRGTPAERWRYLRAWAMRGGRDA